MAHRALAATLGRSGTRRRPLLATQMAEEVAP
jgi:hypothetical protein